MTRGRVAPARWRRGLLRLALLGAVLVACDDEVPDDSVAGELGNGTFRYTCTDSSDPICPRGGTASDFPSRVGVGGFFDVDFVPLDEDALSRTTIGSAATDIIDERGGHLYALRPGVTALLAKRTSDSRVLDIVHLRVAEVADLRVEVDGEPLRLVVQTGERQELRASALDDSGSSLAGARDFEWSVDHPELLRLDLASPAAAMEIYPLAPGSVTLTISTGELSKQLEMTVEGRPVTVDAGVSDAAAEDAAAEDAGPGDARVADGGDAAPPKDAALGEAGALDASSGAEGGVP